MKHNKDFKIIDINGRKYRKEISAFEDLIEGLTSAFYALSITSMGLIIFLSIFLKSLQPSISLDAHLESGTRLRAREVVRV